ncbi:hypothetical protein A1O7_09664 [Cladophialophora yegresii CBS 114405]|uniref:ATP phosphoribosyltransferase n=1 Tax=Cladophialophora yegresii CBS 114405 TaxID=1182544 RepID=W9VQA8_9EURO|nr:uncharacterized protein A1O7_09664 [Cladophialophora yegresii CBS 114405]EXJ54326.1 hypothetical protein A1O7_09664 [Cladophialophora yegresii CBS 114405]
MPEPSTDTDTHTHTNTTTDQTTYKLTFFTPPSATKACLSALHAVGAGVWPSPPPPTLASGTKDTPETSSSSPPKYIDSAFISRGTGQFRPSAHANPTIGTPGEVQVVEEDKVEMVVVGTEAVRRAVAELRRVHPYEVVGLFVVRCEDF